MQDLPINTPYIKLGQILKILSICSGGRAKEFLINNVVLVNQEQVIARGKKVYPGDIVTIANRAYKITRG